MADTNDTAAQYSTAARVLRCRNTHRYFDGTGWTDNPSHAQVFPDDVAATRACITHNLHEVELVLRHDPNSAELFVTTLR